MALALDWPVAAQVGLIELSWGAIENAHLQAARERAREISTSLRRIRALNISLGLTLRGFSALEN